MGWGGQIKNKKKKKGLLRSSQEEITKIFWRDWAILERELFTCCFVWVFFSVYNIVSWKVQSEIATLQAAPSSILKPCQPPVRSVFSQS